MSSGGDLQRPTLASFLSVLIGSSAWRHLEGQELVLVYVGKRKREQLKRNAEDILGTSVRLIE